MYSVGDTWTSNEDSCKIAECMSEFGKVHVVYTKQPCPVIPEDCPPVNTFPINSHLKNQKAEYLPVNTKLAKLYREWGKNIIHDLHMIVGRGKQVR